MNMDKVNKEIVELEAQAKMLTEQIQAFQRLETLKKRIEHDQQTLDEYEGTQK